MSYPMAAVVIKLPDAGHNNFGLEMCSDNTDLVTRFKNIVWIEMQSCYLNDPDYEEKHSWGTFWQGGSYKCSDETSTWEYFEFWHAQTLEFQDKLLAKAFSIAERLGCPVEIH